MKCLYKKTWTLMDNCCQHKLSSTIFGLTAWFITLFIFSLLYGVVFSPLYNEINSSNIVYNVTYLGEERFSAVTTHPKKALNDIKTHCESYIDVNETNIRFDCNNISYIVSLLQKENNNFFSFILIDAFIFIVFSILVMGMVVVILNCKKNKEKTTENIYLNI